jgi:hypothetical protein
MTEMPSKADEKLRANKRMSAVNSMPSLSDLFRFVVTGNLDGEQDTSMGVRERATVALKFAVIKMVLAYGSTNSRGLPALGRMLSDVIAFPSENEPALRRAGKDGRTVAHEAASCGRQFTNPAILKLADSHGWTVAHEAAAAGQQITDPEILNLASGPPFRGTVAHVAAARGQQFTDPEILRIADSTGETVAHTAAARGQQFTDPEILKLTNNRGRTVADYVASYGDE